MCVCVCVCVCVCACAHVYMNLVHKKEGTQSQLLSVGPLFDYAIDFKVITLKLIKRKNK